MSNAFRRPQMSASFSHILTVLLALSITVFCVCLIILLPSYFTTEASVNPPAAPSDTVDVIQTEESEPLPQTQSPETNPLPVVTETDMQTDPPQAETGSDTKEESEPEASETVQTEPIQTQPVQTEPPQTKPIETDSPIIETDPPVTETDPPATDAPETPPVQTEAPDTRPPETETQPMESEPIQTEQTTPPAPSDSDVYVDLIDPEEFADILIKETPLADASYLDNILFLGDSITYGMKYFGMLSGGTATNQILFPSSGTITLYDVPSIYVFDPDRNKDVTVLDAIQWRQPKLLIIALGVNGIGWESKTVFCAEYRELIEAVKSVSPETKIVLQSMLPLTSYHDNSLDRLTNAKISQGNLWIAQIAKEYGLQFLNIAPAMTDEEGFLKSNYSETDGLHLSRAAYLDLIRYYRTHRIDGF